MYFFRRAVCFQMFFWVTTLSYHHLVTSISLKVRNCLRHRNVTSLEENKFQSSTLWPNITKAKFQSKRYKSPSTGLRLKALKLPPQFRISNADDTYITKYYMMYTFLSLKNRDSYDFMTLTSFPVRSDDSIRTGYVVTRPTTSCGRCKLEKKLENIFKTFSLN